MKNKPLNFALALLVVSIWGTTFVSMRVALDNFSPAQVMFFRTIIAYISLLIIYPKTHKSEGLKQELTYFITGLVGTTMYVMLANYALLHTMASNVSVLSSISPIFTALLIPLFIKSAKISRRVMYGFLICTVGTYFVVTNGDFSFQVSIFGDLLALGSAVSWALYSIFLKRIDSEHNQLYITRRIFLYGIITVFPFILFEGNPIDFAIFKQPAVTLNLFFLGLVALTLCHVLWAVVIKNMGPVWAGNFTYLTPLVTIVASVFILGEVVTGYMILGTALILGGVAIAEGTLAARFSKNKDGNLVNQHTEVEN